MNLLGYLKRRREEKKKQEKRINYERFFRQESILQEQIQDYYGIRANVFPNIHKYVIIGKDGEAQKAALDMIDENNRLHELNECALKFVKDKIPDTHPIEYFVGRLRGFDAECDSDFEKLYKIFIGINERRHLHTY